MPVIRIVLLFIGFFHFARADPVHNSFFIAGRNKTALVMDAFLMKLEPGTVFPAKRAGNR
jgi:hypothetical protein